jgi:hypothetical protein
LSMQREQQLAQQVQELKQEAEQVRCADRWCPWIECLIYGFIALLQCDRDSE